MALKSPVTRGVAKVPVVMQMEAVECGAACLTMVLACYGKWIPLERVRSDCGVSRDGTKAGNILRAARRYGLEANGYRYEPEELKREGRFPCIIHWNFNHFVVLRGFRRGRACLNDPARGDYSVTMEEFDESFTGVCLMFAPGPDFRQGGHAGSILSFARKRLQGGETAVLFIMLTTAITALAGLLRTGFARFFLDQILTGRDPEWFPLFALALALVTAAELTAAWMQAVFSFRIQGKLSAVGSTSYLWQVLRLPMDFFSQRMAGDIQQRQLDHESVAGDLVNTLAPLALNTAMMLLYLVVMFRYSPLLASIGLASVMGNVCVSWMVSRKRVNITRVMMRDEGKLSSATVSGIEMIETIKSSGAENGYFERWAGIQASVNTQKVRYQKLEQYLGAVPAAILSLANIFVLTLGVGLILRGAFTSGMVLAFQGIFSAFTDPAQKLISAGQTLQEMRTRMERIEDVMEYPVDAAFTARAASEQDAEADGEAKKPQTFRKLTGAISMRGVTFGYSPLAEPLIRDFDLELKPGNSVAFVGSSGCGKSTLAKLLTGLYQPWSGEILFDGKPIVEIDRNVFVGSVGVVDQEIILFEDTVANNVRMWDQSIEDFEVIMAVRDAKLHEDIMQRDNGYNYRMMEGGRDFSGGQRQRIEIARVLSQDPTILILDEATSALDAQTEFEVVRSIKDRGLTSIVIAHRLSTIRDCDEIIVMERGQVVERGTHEELMAKQGAYTRLVSSE